MRINNVIYSIIVGLLALSPVFVGAKETLRSNPNIARDLVPQFDSADFGLDKPHEPQEVLIKFGDGASEEDMNKIISKFGITNEDPSTQRAVRLKIDTDRMRQMRKMREFPDRDRGYPEDAEALSSEDEILTDVLNLLMLRPEIEYAEPNYIATGLSYPNDTYYKLQWNLPLVGAEEAWNSSTGSGVTIAVLDTGVAYENYREFAKASDLSETSFVPGFDFVNNDNRPNDDNGHGTHVTGTIASTTGNGYGVAGIAHGASIMPVKVLNNNISGTYSDIADGIYYAVDNGADIINMSLGGRAFSQTLLDAVKYAHERNVLVVAASGNGGESGLLYPAAFDDYVLAVGAVEYNKSRASYSSYGTSLDLVAPGGNIEKDDNRDGFPDGILQETLKRVFGNAIKNKTGFYFYQGTSMSAPHVSAIAALVKSVGVSKISDIQDILFSTAEDIGAPGVDSETGWGIVRADLAVKRALELQNPKQEDIAEETQTSENGDTADIDENEQQDKTKQPVIDNDKTNNEESDEKQDKAEKLENMLVRVKTYNSWGRPDRRFSFWEKAFLNVKVENNRRKKIPDALINIEIFDDNDQLIAKGSGKSDKEGELWLELGNFARGTYTVVAEAVKDGFSTAVNTIKFRFR